MAESRLTNSSCTQMSIKANASDASAQDLRLGFLAVNAVQKADDYAAQGVFVGNGLSPEVASITVRRPIKVVYL